MLQLDSEVHETYKNKHFPASCVPVLKSKTQDTNPSNASPTVPNTAHHSLHGLSPSFSALVSDFSGLRIEAEAPPTELSPSPPCPIAALPEELLVEIFKHLAVQDVASFARIAQVCKRLAFLVTTEDGIWKRISIGSEFGFGAMHYTWACNIDGSPLYDGEEETLVLLQSVSKAGQDHELGQLDSPTPPRLTTALVPSAYPNFRALFRRRPRIRFNGCYISTINYARPGAASPTSVSWNSPIQIVTYYRYLRFLRDGTCISLLTTSAPVDVISYLHTENIHTNHGALPSAPMKDALLGRWRLSGPRSTNLQESESEGTLHVETEGAAPRYLYKMAFSLASAGKGVRNNKLAWQGYWSYNRLADDWAEFQLKNDGPYYWSRVKSYETGM